MQQWRPKTMAVKWCSQKSYTIAALFEALVRCSLSYTYLQTKLFIYIEAISIHAKFGFSIFIRFSWSFDHRFCIYNF